jgi:hypothetical protein
MRKNGVTSFETFPTIQNLTRLRAMLWKKFTKRISVNTRSMSEIFKFRELDEFLPRGVDFGFAIIHIELLMFVIWNLFVECIIYWWEMVICEKFTYRNFPVAENCGIRNEIMEYVMKLPVPWILEL